MLNVFVKSTEEICVQLSNGRIMFLNDLLNDYEGLLKETKSAIPKVGEWFRIDRKVIEKNREKIYRACSEEGDEGKILLKEFDELNHIADQNPNKYSNVMETYVFRHNWKSKTQQEMRDMCKTIGDGMCDEVICALELQMRICNGESVYNLTKTIDTLPRVRVIELRDGGTGYWGGANEDEDLIDASPASLTMSDFFPNLENFDYTPYAYRRIL